MKVTDYFCPLCKSELTSIKDALQCPNGHTFSLIEGSEAPIFECEAENANEYNIAEAAKIHDNSLSWLFATFGGDEQTLRENLMSRLRLKKGQKVLITGTGAGNDLPYLSKLLGDTGTIYAQDYSTPMLASAIERCKKDFGMSDYDINFSVSDATNLPFENDSFDATYHFGGLNIFPDIAKGIAEMDRVTKDGGRVVFGDEGLPPWLKDTEYGKMIINNNPLCGFEAPLEYMPQTARDVNVSWAVGYCFYIIDYTARSKPIDINIDAPHVGTRGGSIRSRYFGQLEGVSVELKEQLYREAEKRGISRVEFLEGILNKALTEN